MSWDPVPMLPHICGMFHWKGLASSLGSSSYITICFKHDLHWSLNTAMIQSLTHLNINLVLFETLIIFILVYRSLALCCYCLQPTSGNILPTHDNAIFGSMTLELPETDPAKILKAGPCDPKSLMHPSVSILKSLVISIIACISYYVPYILVYKSIIWVRKREAPRLIRASYFLL